MTSGDQLILGGFAIAGVAFPVVFFLYVRLKQYVSKKKVHDLEDVSQLWESVSPPSLVVNDRGLQLRRYGIASIVIVLLGAGVIAVLELLEMSSRQTLMFAIMAASLLTVMVCESRLKHHISRERVCAVQDVSRLWTFAAPPESVLNEKGLRLYRQLRMSTTVFFIGMGIVLVGSIFGNDMPVGWGTNS